MKRLILITMVALVVFFGMVITYANATNLPAAGDIFIFGQYEQDNDVGNGFEPIEWLVLADDDGKILLLSKYALDYQSYHNSDGDIVWKDASVRAWLNKEFLSTAFSKNEQDAILVSVISNAAEKGNAEWQTIAGDDTEDKIFLLSVSEANHYFEDNAARKNRGTESARAQGARLWPLEETDWWLRSPGKVQHDAGFVGTNGGYHSNAATDKKGIRPALWLSTTASQEGFTANQYQTAQSLFDAEQFEEAAMAFEALGAYADSAVKVLESKYAQALNAMNDQEYAFAITLFEDLEDYADSYAQARECRYLQAVMVQESGDFKKAVELYGQLGHYKDSIARLKTCFGALGVSIYYATETAVNAGTDTGYTKSDSIGVNDVHFGWRLGRFMMSGFTRVSEDAKGHPIFIKTLGDKVTLWFELEQDIARLNGNEDLFINEDNNGYDEYFGVPRTNFGKGAMITRHRDYQNSLSDPVIYTDFLSAKESYGANTKVEFFEEGDYEVTLNYEIGSKTLAVMNKYDNYSIRFSFSVRNGNVMVFPFDVVTGAELSNTAITENGFYLDLAKSRYLDINIKRSVLTEGASGITEDQRFNRPAKDGDRYTQEGIYTITVYNRYTGEQTEKQIFVGTDELLKEYVANGFSLNVTGK
jgi:hypothetical protein